MKRVISLLALVLAGLLSLSGCASMLERGYSNSEAHVDYPVVEDDSTLRVETYQGLVNSILYYINEHSGLGSIRLYNYGGEVETDLAAACAEVVGQDPLAGYAVRELSYEITRILTYYEVELRVTYDHTAAELAAIRPLSGASALRQELAAMVEERRSGGVYLLSYFTGDAGLVEELFHLARYADPAGYVDLDDPVCQVTFYPEEGSRRVAEVTVRWGADAREEDYSRRLEEAAALLLEANPSGGGNYTVEELADILRDNAVWQEDGSDLALAALSGEPASELGLALAMEYLCQRTGIEAVPVLGSGGRGLWLIVSTPDGYRHLLPQGLIPSEEEPGEEEGQEEEPERLFMYTDEELAALGYSWTASLYHACVDLNPEPEPSSEPPEAAG